MKHDPGIYEREIFLTEEKIYDLENKNKINIDDYSFLNSSKLTSVEIEEEINEEDILQSDEEYEEVEEEEEV